MPRRVDIVVKLGGGVLADTARLDGALAAISEAARTTPLLVVPGGGPFADAVRDVDRRLRIADDAAHWMAILAMDQYAQLVAARLAGGVVVEDPAQLPGWPTSGVTRSPAPVPVLAPYRWLRAVDPLPHSWAVTSDSIAAWVAAQIGARKLVLVKPPGAASGERVDDYFARTLPPGVTAVIVPADRLDLLTPALRT
jgi:5-(aminomethyl)-3-furanmethanol phosphate kinase